MTFLNSIKTCYMKSFDFKGRASKSEYWWFWLFQLVLCVLTHYAVDLANHEMLNGIFVCILIGVIIASVPANISSMVRRFHDAGLSTWTCIKRLLQIVGLSFLGIFIFAIFGSSIIVCLIALLWPFIGLLFLFMVLIGDSAYDEDEEE